MTWRDRRETFVGGAIAGAGIVCGGVLIVAMLIGLAVLADWVVTR